MATDQSIPDPSEVPFLEPDTEQNPAHPEPGGMQDVAAAIRELLAAFLGQQQGQGVPMVVGPAAVPGAAPVAPVGPPILPVVPPRGGRPRLPPRASRPAPQPRIPEERPKFSGPGQGSTSSSSDAFTAEGSPTSRTKVPEDFAPSIQAPRGEPFVVDEQPDVGEWRERQSAPSGFDENWFGPKQDEVRMDPNMQEEFGRNDDQLTILQKMDEIREEQRKFHRGLILVLHKIIMDLKDDNVSIEDIIRHFEQERLTL